MEKLEIALTGNRFSGKHLVAKSFERIGVPVFYADTVFKFLINNRYFPSKEKNSVGQNIFVNGFFLPSTIKNDDDFDKLFDIVEFEMFSTYEKFKKKANASYVVFMSSLIFERKYNDKFDYVINVFAPKDTRVMRALHETGLGLMNAHQLVQNEICEYEKNGKSDFVIHSYDNGPKLMDQINEIDSKIVESLLKGECQIL